jgi:transcriptional regulator with XRE-family HTH domain
MVVLKNQYTGARISCVEVNPNRLKELRQARGLSVRRLAKEAGVSTETVYSVEHGRRQPSVRTLGKLARALGVEAKDLLA